MKFVLSDRVLMSLELTTMGSWKRSLNCNIITNIIQNLYSCYWYNTTDRGIRVDLHHGLVEINDLEENLIFYITKNIFVDIDVDADELNGVLSSNAHTEVDEDNNDKINVEDCDGDKDESIDEEEDNSD